MAESSSSALNWTLDTIGKCKGPANYREWGRKVRQASGLYAREMLEVLDGAPRPADTDADGVAAWETANNKINSILFFLTKILRISPYGRMRARNRAAWVMELRLGNP